MNQLFSTSTGNRLDVKAPCATSVGPKCDLLSIGGKDGILVVPGIESKPGVRSPQQIDQPDVAGPSVPLTHGNAALIWRKPRLLKIAVGSNDPEILTRSIEPSEFG